MIANGSNIRGMIRLLLVSLMVVITSSGMPPIEHHTADVNGVRLHYAQSGSGQLMLFLHGFPEFWYAWKNQLDEFGRDHLAVAPDMRGFNLSSKPEGVEQYRMPLLVEDVRALAAKLGASPTRKFILVGHDWGGVVAWAFAAAHPAMLEKLIIVNAPHPAVFQRELRDNPAQQKASQYMLMFRALDAEKMLSANDYQMLVNAVMGEGLKQGHFTDADKKAYLEAWSQPGALTGGLNYYRAAQVGPPSGTAPATSPALPSATVNVPTLVIWGEKDTALLTGNLNGLDAFVPQLTIRRIPEGTHWVVHEQAAVVNRHIREFIRR
jgi:pimeloyl-ACP methyl ester carboxylesterase